MRGAQFAAFRYFGGVPRSILYDNTTLAVARILGGGRRKRTRVFSELQSHYLRLVRSFRAYRAKAIDKGKVEGLVGYARRNFMVPAPRFPSWEAFNEQLEAQCLNNRKRRLRRHTETIEERFKRDRQALLPLLAHAPMIACDKRTTRVTSLSLRALSLPTTTRCPHAHGRQVTKIVICCGTAPPAQNAFTSPVPKQFSPTASTCRADYWWQSVGCSQAVDEVSAPAGSPGLFGTLACFCSRAANASCASTSNAWIRGASCNNSASYLLDTFDFPSLPALKAGAGTGALCATVAASVEQVQ